MITAISWPTTLTIRHSRFAMLTLAKHVASLALHPPVSATEADYAPQGEAFAEDDLLNCRSLPRLIPAPNHAPPWHADFIRRGLAKPDHRGKRQKRTGGACSRPGGSSFSLPRGWGGSAACQFNLIDFYVTHRFFVTFFPEESNVPLVPLRPLTSPLPARQAPF